MRINDVIDNLLELRNEYGNAEVFITDIEAPADVFIIKSYAVEDQDPDEVGATGIVFIDSQKD